MVALVGSDSTDAMAEPWSCSGVEGKVVSRIASMGGKDFFLNISITNG